MRKLVACAALLGCAGACVKIPAEVDGTFAPPRPGEPSNYRRDPRRAAVVADAGGSGVPGAVSRSTTLPPPVPWTPSAERTMTSGTMLAADGTSTEGVGSVPTTGPAAFEAPIDAGARR